MTTVRLVGPIKDAEEVLKNGVFLKWAYLTYLLEKMASYIDEEFDDELDAICANVQVSIYDGHVVDTVEADVPPGVANYPFEGASSSAADSVFPWSQTSTSSFDRSSNIKANNSKTGNTKKRKTASAALVSKIVEIVDLTEDGDDVVETHSSAKRARSDADLGPKNPYLQCDLCKSKFHEVCLDGDGDKHIVSTPCGHLYCNDCLTSHVKNLSSTSRVVACPTCSSPLVVSVAAMMRLHLNFKY